MQPLANHTPFAAGGLWTRDEAGQEVWLLAIKATFAIDPEGKQEPLPVQPPPNLGPVPAPDPDELLDDDDFNIEKKHTDILVAGHVYPPGGEPAREASARIKVGSVDKLLKVSGDRPFLPGAGGVKPGQPAPFAKMPIGWSRSFGGGDRRAPKPDWDMRNPVGTGYAADHKELVGKAAPNFEYPDSPFRDHRTGRPAGFGCVSRHWLPRSRHAGTYDAAWRKTRDPLPPHDFSRLYYQCAPEDQQTDKPLIGYEEVRLGGFSPEGFQHFLLPRITFDIRSHFRNRPDIRHDEALLHTLRLLPEARRFSLTWMSILPVPYDEEHLVNSTIRVRRRTGISPTIARTGVWIGPS